MHGCEQNLLHGVPSVPAAAWQLGGAASGAQQGLHGVPSVPAAAWQLGGAASGAQQGLQGVPLVPAAAWQLGSAASGAQHGLQGVPAVLAQGAQGPQVQILLWTARACAGLGCGVAATRVCRAQPRVRVACLSPVCAGSATGFAGAGVCRPAAAASSQCARRRWSFQAPPQKIPAQWFQGTGVGRRHRH